MNFKALSRGELLASIGGVLLGVSLFVSWYTLGNRHAQVGNCHGPNSTCTGWDSLEILRYLLLIAAIAPAILAWIIVRGHALSWPRGELTAVTALLALTVIVFRGVIDKPGSPPEEIGITSGWWLALAAGFMILGGSVWRAQQSGARRKPPGVL